MGQTGNPMSEETLESKVGSGDPPEVEEEQPEEGAEEVVEEKEPEKEPEPEKKRSVLDDLREERAKRREAQAELERLKSKPPIDEDETVKQARSWFDKEYERRSQTERESQQKAEDDAVEATLSQIEDLKTTFEDFDETAVVDFANKNDISNLETAYWRLKAEAPVTTKAKPKLPSGTKTTDEVKVETSPNADAGKSIFQIVREEVAKRGIK